MNASQSEVIIQQYLDRVAAHLGDLHAEERNEILSDLRSHIEEAVGNPALASEVEVRNVLERLGDPAELAREARDRVGEDSDTAQPSRPERRLNKTPGTLEVAAIILTALFWPIGVLLAWISSRWLTRDKVIATLIPASATLLVAVIGMAGVIAYGGEATQVSVIDEPVPAQPGSEADQRSPSVITDSTDNMSVIGRLLVVVVFVGGVLAGPFISAIYLAVRLQPVEELIQAERDRKRDGIPARGHA